MKNNFSLDTGLIQSGLIYHTFHCTCFIGLQIINYCQMQGLKISLVHSLSLVPGPKNLGTSLYPFQDHQIWYQVHLMSSSNQICSRSNTTKSNHRCISGPNPPNLVHGVPVQNHQIWSKVPGQRLPHLVLGPFLIQGH